MIQDPFGDCFLRKKSARMLGKTRDCPLNFHAWLVYSFLRWKRRYEEGVTAKDIAEFTGLHRSSTIKRALQRLQEIRLATKEGRLWRALPQPVDPPGEVKFYKMGELLQIVPGPQPLRPWFATKKKQPKHKHAPSWALYLPTKDAPLTLIQCGLLFLLNSLRVSVYPTIQTKQRTHSQLARMLGVHHETIPKALLALETHGLIRSVPHHYELIKPRADRLAWFRDATRPSFMEPQEWKTPAQMFPGGEFRLEIMQHLVGGGIPAAMCVELVEFSEKNGISLEKLRRYYQEVRITHKQNRLEGRYTEISHCGFLLKKRLEKVVKNG